MVKASGVVTGDCKLSTQEAEYSVLSGTAANSGQPDLKDNETISQKV